LIEMIGVLAIIAIVAAVLVPATIRQMDAAAKTREWTDLSAISNALTLHIVQNKSFPAPSPGKTLWPGGCSNRWPGSRPRPRPGALPARS
jgi:type II secretory pathway pseudopilin PulG